MLVEKVRFLICIWIYHPYLHPVRPLKEAPPLPQDPHLATKSSKAEMEDFLDDLLA
jgi:hypothetical protein